MPASTLPTTDVEVRSPVVVSRKRPNVWVKFLRNPSGVIGLGVLIIIILATVFAPFLTNHSPAQQNLAQSFFPPGKEGHVFGTDSLGRDVYSRLLFGGRLSLLISLIATVVGMGIGVPIGVISGYYSGRLDNIIMRIVDILLAFPYLLLSIVIVGGLGPGLTNVMLSISISTIPFYVRLLRGLTLNVRNLPFIEAAKTIGASNFRIIRHCVMRTLLPYIIVNATLNTGYVLLAVSGLNFLGFGVQPPTPEWGAMLAENRSFITIAPFSVLVPGTVIALTVLALNMTGDALRDALDVNLSDAR